MGKTTFAMNLAEHAAIKSNVPVAVFSMEMPADALAMRMLSSLGQIDQHRLRTGRLNDDDWPRLTSAIALLNEAPLFIDDTPALTVTELRARARRLKREHGLSMIVIDYIQLMQGSSRSSNENRATEISEISRSLKALAKELEVPVVAIVPSHRNDVAVELPACIVVRLRTSVPVPVGYAIVYFSLKPFIFLCYYQYYLYVV